MFRDHRRVLLALLIAVLILTGSMVEAAGRQRAVGPSVPAPQENEKYISSQVEFYLDQTQIGYIRPGLKIKVNSVTMGSDRKPVVDLTITDSFDQPIDRLGKTTPGVVSISMILAEYNPASRRYLSHTTRTVTSPGTSPTPNVTAIQAAADSQGTWTDYETGHARYVFRTAMPANCDESKTHTIGIYSTRNMMDTVGKNYYANVEYDYRPDGGTVSAKWDKVRDASSCLNCHDPLALHGGSRRDVKLCVLCHSPQTSDPDTGNVVDMAVMTHKIHRGANLSKPYVIIGNQGSVHDYSNIHLPQDIRNCDNCHAGTNPASEPTQSDVWFTQPAASVCGSCHDDVDFATGQNHPAGAQADDSKCASCHIPDSGQEFDASIKGAHVIPTKSKQLKGLTAKIVNVTDFAPGKKPTITFALKYADGTVVDGTKLSSFSPMIAGATSSYTKYYRENALTKGVFDPAAGTTSYTFAAMIPEDAKGSWAISLDAYKTVDLKRADGKPDITGIRDAAKNPVMYAPLTEIDVEPRRVLVSMASCNKCHDNLALHGGQRQNIDECVMCHNPVNSDAAVRPANAGQAESISMQRMIHRIHKGAELTQEYTVYGRGGSRNNYNGIHYPGDLRNCAACHTGGTQSLPVSTDAGNVTTLRDYFTNQGPGTAACLGCHDSRDAAAHAYLNTTTFPGASDPAEACAACHGRNSEWSVDKVHAR